MHYWCLFINTGVDVTFVTNVDVTQVITTAKIVVLRRHSF